MQAVGFHASRTRTPLPLALTASADDFSWRLALIACADRLRRSPAPTAIKLYRMIWAASLSWGGSNFHDYREDVRSSSCCPFQKLFKERARRKIARRPVPFGACSSAAIATETLNRSSTTFPVRWRPSNTQGAIERGGLLTRMEPGVLVEGERQGVFLPTVDYVYPWERVTHTQTRKRVTRQPGMW